MSKKVLLLLILCACTTQYSFAQEKGKEKGKEPIRDSAAVYKKIQEYSRKRGFTKWLHGLIFEPIRVKKDIARNQASEKKQKKIPKRNFKAFEGKIIRSITVETFDPFGYSEKDPSVSPKTKLAKFGNRIHLKSKVLTIKNLILLRRNRPLDSLLLRESERLIRTQRFVRGVLITPKLVSKNSDSVDVDIRVLDSWSLIPDVSGNPNRASFEIAERNFLGIGHEFRHGYERDFNNGNDAYSTRYTIPNIMNTYIRTTLNYQINLEKDYIKSLNIERPFFSPFARWAAGAYFDQQFRNDTLPDAAGVFDRQFFKHNTSDFWAGHAYRIFRSNSENDRTTNLITSLRYLKINYTESPRPVYDTIDFYSDERFYLAGIGVSSRQFTEDKFIFNYGIIEDVPVGRAAGIVGGWQEKNGTGRLYLGGRIATGKYYKWGYLSANLEYGTFVRHSTTTQSAFSIQANYFTNLLESGEWKKRLFVKGRLVFGQNRQPSWGDMLTLSDRTDIPGFNPSLLFGTKKFVLTTQLQTYSPWNLLGFRLNPYFNASIGFLGDVQNGFGKSRAYPQLAAGFIITNDYLVFSAFQLSLAYYPTIPGQGDDLFKTNAISSDDFGFQSFDLSKPQTVDYR
jgi:hypothetical protein